MPGVAALVRQEDPLNLWGGVLVASAVVILILPICAVPWVFGGTRAFPLDSEQPQEKAPLSKVSAGRLPGLHKQVSCGCCVWCMQGLHGAASWETHKCKLTA